MQNERSFYFHIHFNHSMQKFEDYWNAILFFIILYFVVHYLHFSKNENDENLLFLFLENVFTYKKIDIYILLLLPTWIISRIFLRFSNFLQFWTVNITSSLFQRHVYCYIILTYWHAQDLYIYIYIYIFTRNSSLYHIILNKIKIKTLVYNFSDNKNERKKKEVKLFANSPEMFHEAEK